MFPACVVTRAQSLKFEDVVNLSEVSMAPPDETVESVSADPSATSELTVNEQSTNSPVAEPNEVTLSSHSV